MKLVFDIESDSTDIMSATKVWCIVAKDIDTSQVYKIRPDKIKRGIELLRRADLLIGHNILAYDLPLLQCLHGFGIDDWPKCYDTLIMSRLLYNGQYDEHSLRAWGERLGDYKGDHKDFTKYSDDMLQYCEQDININHKLYNLLIKEEQKYLRIKYAKYIEHEFAKIISQQVLNGFSLNIFKCQELLAEFDIEIRQIESQIVVQMPKVLKGQHLKDCEKKGLLIERKNDGYWYKTPAKGQIKFKKYEYEEPNPNSRQQIIDWFIKKYNWKPNVFTEKKNPKIDEKILQTLKYPEAQSLARLFRLHKQRSMIDSNNNISKGWLQYINPNTGKIHGHVITNGAITGRCTHNSPNVAQVDRKDKRMREVWIPRKGMKLISCDAEALELRLLGHFLAEFDKGAFAFEVVRGDIHTSNQQAVGLHKRDTAKTMIYALIYGSGDKKLGSIVASDFGIRTTSYNKLKNLGEEVRKRIADNITGYTELLNKISQESPLQGWDGRPLFPRAEHSILNTLIQGLGAVVMKLALINLWRKAANINRSDWGLCANIHDEIVLECKPELADEFKRLCEQAIADTTKQLKLRCEMSGLAKIGDNWAEVH